MGGTVRRQALSGRVDELEDELAAQFARTPTGAGSARLELRLAGDDDVTITRVLGDTGRSGELRPRDRHLIVWAGDGTVTFTTSDGITCTVAGVEPALLRADYRYTYRVEASRLTLLAVSDRLLRARPATAGTVTTEPLEFGHDDEQALELAETLGIAGAAIVLECTPTAQREKANILIADQVLRAFPVSSLSGRGAYVEAAKEWMRHHARGAMTVSDVADAAGVHVRTLQQAFQADVGTTPMGWLRQYRIEQIHDELRRADPDTAVGSLARSWGVTHLGRFASAYQTHFGELPHTTLTNARDR